MDAGCQRFDRGLRSHRTIVAIRILNFNACGTGYYLYFLLCYTLRIQPNRITTNVQYNQSSTLKTQSNTRNEKNHRNGESNSNFFVSLLTKWTKPIVVLLIATVSIFIAVSRLGMHFLQFNYETTNDIVIAGTILFINYTGSALIALLGLCGIDYCWKRYRQIQRLKMDEEEFKREHRESEGDPQTKSMRKRLHQELSRQRLIQEVRKARVIITGKV